MLDAEGRVVSWNAGAEKIKGYSAAEITGCSFSCFFTSEDRENGVPEHILQEAEKTGRCEGEGWRVRKDGSRFWASDLIEAIRDDSGALHGFAEITRDISERHSAQEALRESERQFRLLVDSVIDYAIFMLDPSGIVISWNIGAQRLKGYRAEEIIGQHFSRFYPREDRAAGMPARFLETAAREGRCETEGWRLRKDGSRFRGSVVIDAIRSEDGELIGFAKITRDITERYAAQEALQESERQFRLLVQGVTDYALYMLDPNGIVTSWNAGAQRIKGYSADEIIGQHFSRFYTETDRSAGLPTRTLYTAAREGRLEADGWRLRKDGSLFWANVVIDAIRDGDGTLVGFAKITRDITERREAQVRLQKAQVERDYAQKMEALGQLTGGIAHDFNNLLMIVGAHLLTVRKLVAHDAKGMRAAEAIEIAAQRGEALTRQMLSFARRQTLKPVVVALGERIEEVRSLLTTPMGALAKLVTNVPPGLWAVKIDVSEFELALVNIALNARGSMPQGGVVTISAENRHVEPGGAARDLKGDFVALSISDTGTGIAPDILPRVFDPFFTTKRSGGGTGLGLSQVHGFAHQTGGAVTIDSEMGRGTTVTLYLPRADREPEAFDAETSTEAAEGGSVLLVEDNPEVAEVTTALLEQLGYKVETRGNAQKGIEALGRRSFDLLVSDIVMAGEIDGLGLARDARQRDPQLPIVLVTGYADTALLAGAEFCVLRKPYRLADLSRMIAKAMGEIERPPSNLVRLQDRRNPDSDRRG